MDNSPEMEPVVNAVIKKISNIASFWHTEAEEAAQILQYNTLAIANIDKALAHAQATIGNSDELVDQRTIDQKRLFGVKSPTDTAIFDLRKTITTISIASRAFALSRQVVNRTAQIDDTTINFHAIEPMQQLEQYLKDGVLDPEQLKENSPLWTDYIKWCGEELKRYITHKLYQDCVATNENPLVLIRKYREKELSPSIFMDT